MRFLVTGATGFAGTHLIDKLIKEGHSVVAILRNSIPKDNLLRNNIDDIVPFIVDSMNVDGVMITPSLKEPFELYGDKIDGVFHLAAFTHPGQSFNDPAETFKINTTLTINICKLMQEYCPKAVLMHCSTCEVYGVVDGIITEETTFNPMNPYAVSKAASELYVSERFRNKFLKGFITRAFSHTGPGRRQTYSIASDAVQIAKILKYNLYPMISVGNLEAQRVVIDVRDVVNAYYLLMMGYMDGKVEDGEAFNISGELEKLMRIGQYLDIMLEISGVQAKLKTDPRLFRPIDIPVQKPDSSKIKQKFNWEPLIPIKETLSDLLDYWKERV